MGLEKFWLDLESQKRFWWVSKTRFWVIFASRMSRIFFADGSRRLRFVVFFFWVELFRLHGYSLWNWGSKDKAVYWWAFASFHWRFRSFYLAWFVPLSRNWIISLGLKFSNQGLAVVAKSRIYYSVPLQVYAYTVCCKWMHPIGIY